MSEEQPEPVTSEFITHQVITAMSAAPDPRVREILTELVSYAHDFVRKVLLRPQELLSAAEYLRACGEMSDDSRHEFILLADVLGITMATETLASDAPDGAFENSVLGPFYRQNAPLLPLGANLSRGADDGDPVLVSGRVTSTADDPVSGAMLDVWGTNQHGLYENVDPAQPDFNLRGRFLTGPDGEFHFWTVKPVSYPIPDDGPVGQLLRAAGRHNIRPAHLHFILSADNFATVVSELYSSDDPYLGEDAVFGVKPSLVVRYIEQSDPEELDRHGRTEPFWALEHHFVLVPGDRAEVSFTTTPAVERSAQ